MNYAAIDLFKKLFQAEGGPDGRTLSTSDYADHLGGKKTLTVIQKNAKFCLGKVKEGKVVEGSPLVRFKKGKEEWAGLFLKQSLPAPKEQLERVAKFYGMVLSVPQEIDLPFLNAELAFSAYDGDKPFRFLEEALEFVRNKVVSVDDLNEWEAGLPFLDAPFCIQSWFLSHGELPDWAEPYLDAKGLPQRNEKTAQWWKENTAPYCCSKMSKEGFCDLEACLQRKFGKGQGMVPSVWLGQLTQYKNEPVFYVWLVDGKEVRFDSESDIIQHDRFCRVCMRQIGVLPEQVTKDRWLKIVNKALSNMKVIGTKETDDLTIDTLRDILVNDFKDRTFVSSFYEHERLMQGCVYLDPTNSTFVVEPYSLCSYITGKYKDLRIENSRAFLAALRHLGFRGKNRSIDGIEKVLWYVRSEFLFKDRTEWKNYMLSVSEGTAWELNFRAFLEDEADNPPELSKDIKDEIDADVAVFLDTEKGDA